MCAALLAGHVRMSCSHRLLGLFLAIILLGCVGKIREESAETVSTSTAQANVLAVQLRRPNYRSDLSSTRTLLVDASEAQPARVLIEGLVLSNVASATMTLDHQGVGGVDITPAVPSSLYYLYAVKSPSEVNRGKFELEASLSSPDHGPQNQKDWSYLGAFLTDAYGLILPCVSSNGTVFIDGDIPKIEHDKPQQEFKILPIPEKAVAVYGALKISKINVISVSSFASTSSNTDTSSLTLTYKPQFKEDVNPVTRGWLPLFLPRTVFLMAGSKLESGKTEYSVNPTQFHLLGWQEDPSVWK